MLLTNHVLRQMFCFFAVIHQVAIYG